MQAIVRITLRNDILDPQGKAIEQALGGLGFDGIEGVRQGKLIEIALADGLDEATARARVEEMCKKLLANPVIEDYAVELIA